MMIRQFAAREILKRIACRSRVALYMSSPPPRILLEEPEHDERDQEPAR